MGGGKRKKWEKEKLFFLSVYEEKRGKGRKGGGEKREKGKREKEREIGGKGGGKRGVNRESLYMKGRAECI